MLCCLHLCIIWGCTGVLKHKLLRGESRSDFQTVFLKMDKTNEYVDTLEMGLLKRKKNQLKLIHVL